MLVKKKTIRTRTCQTNQWSRMQVINYVGTMYDCTLYDSDIISVKQYVLICSTYHCNYINMYWND